MNENKTNNASNYLGQIEGHLQRKLIRKNEVLKKIQQDISAINGVVVN